MRTLSLREFNSGLWSLSGWKKDRGLMKGPALTLTHSPLSIHTGNDEDIMPAPQSYWEVTFIPLFEGLFCHKAKAKGQKCNSMNQVILWQPPVTGCFCKHSLCLVVYSGYRTWWVRSSFSCGTKQLYNLWYYTHSKLNFSSVTSKLASITTCTTGLTKISENMWHLCKVSSLLCAQFVFDS